MAHIETKDPFGFVGSHVIRRQPRKKGGEEHGWLTRYDEALDCYTLFVPGKGEPRLLARGEVMKFLSAPNIELHNDDHDEFPPPVKDTTTSRYLGVKLRRPREGSGSDRNSDVDDDVRGYVNCFLPFGDRYIVEYEDGTVDEISEAAVIDGMIALIKSPFFSPKRKKVRNGSLRSKKHPRGFMEELDNEPILHKRQRNNDRETQEIPAGSVEVVEDTAEDPQTDENNVAFLDLTPVKVETEADLNCLEIKSSSISNATRQNALEMASHPMEKVKESKVADTDFKRLESTNETENVPTVSEKPVPYYLVTTKPHVAVEPFPRRAMAFELLRASLLNLLDHREATSVKLAMQYDLLRNSDVRDRDAVIRFMGADGLLVLNHLLSAFANDRVDDEEEEENENLSLRDRMKRDNELLHVLKIVAMLPTPSRDQVIASNIGKTINYLSKTRGPPGRQHAIPKCISALAKWIKTSWIKNIPSAPKTKAAIANDSSVPPPQRLQQQARRGGRGNSSGRPSLQLNRRQLLPSQRPHRQVFSISKTQEEHQALRDHLGLARPNQVAPVYSKESSALSQLPVSRPVRGGLKPDWIRQKENLSRSRFCIDDKGPRHGRVTSAPVVSSPSPAAIPPQDSNPDQHETAGGPDGVFGRPQKLRFGKRWSTREFGIQDPPGTLRQSSLRSSSYATPSSYGRSQYSNQHFVSVPPVPSSSRQPRSILRRVSRYNDEPVLDGPDMSGD